MNGENEPLLGNHNAQELVFQAFGSYHEVEQGNFRRHFRKVMRVAQFGGDVETEIFAVLDDVFAETQHFDTTFETTRPL